MPTFGSLSFYSKLWASDDWWGPYAAHARDEWLPRTRIPVRSAVCDLAFAEPNGRHDVLVVGLEGRMPTQQREGQPHINVFKINELTDRQ